MKRLTLLAGAAAVALYVGTQHPGTAPVTTSATGPVTANANEQLANQMAASYGWTGSQATCLDELWTHESGFDAYSANSTSDARGIPQKITGWSGDYQPGAAGAQIKWGLDYIHDRYGSPCAAWSFEMSHTPNWY